MYSEKNFNRVFSYLMGEKIPVPASHIAQWLDLSLAEVNEILNSHPGFVQVKKEVGRAKKDADEFIGDWYVDRKVLG